MSLQMPPLILPSSWLRQPAHQYGNLRPQRSFLPGWWASSHSQLGVVADRLSCHVPCPRYFLVTMQTPTILSHPFFLHLVQFLCFLVAPWACIRTCWCFQLKNLAL